MRHSIALLTAALLLGAGPAAAADAGVMPPGWFAAGSAPQDYVVEVVETGACGGKAARLRSVAAAPKGNVTAMQVFRADKYRGMRLRLTARVTTKDVTGWAGLWMRVDGPGKQTLAFDNMQSRPLKGSTPCAPAQVVLDVANEAEVIALGLVLEGAGTAELAGVDLEAVDDTVPTTVVTAGVDEVHPEEAIGRVGNVWFSHRVVNRLNNNVRLRLVAPGRWTDAAGNYTAKEDGERVVATALDLAQSQPLALSGELTLRREGDVTVIEGTWGTSVKKHPVTIRFSKQAVDMTWGFYERHLKVERAPQLDADCVYYAQWASPTRQSDALQLCGEALSANPPRVQTVMAFLLSGFRRFGTGLKMDEPAQPPVLPK